MHERAVVFETARKLAMLAGDDPVGAVTLGVNPETDSAVVESAWRDATLSTGLGEATLTFVTRYHDLQCLDCGGNYNGDRLTVCPRCGGNGLVVEAAPEVTLDSWQVARVL